MNAFGQGGRGHRRCRGIGRATAIALAQEGANIVGIDISAPVDMRSGVEAASPDELKETGQLVQAAGGRWLGSARPTQPSRAASGCCRGGARVRRH